jgi:hypothetical protein
MEVVTVDLAEKDDAGKLKAFGGSASDKANMLVIGKTVLGAADTDGSADMKAILSALKALKPSNLASGMTASLMVQIYVAACDSLAKARRCASLIERGEHLAHAARLAVTHTALADELGREGAAANLANAKESRRIYMRDLMRRRRALAKLDKPALRVVAS